MGLPRSGARGERRRERQRQQRGRTRFILAEAPKPEPVELIPIERRLPPPRQQPLAERVDNPNPSGDGRG
jgi:hypothetical protein